MNVTENSVAELTWYLRRLKELVAKLPLEQPLHADGKTIGQIAFHTAQSANDWLSNYILEKPFPRNRNHEFDSAHSLKEIVSAIDNALNVCRQIVRKKISLTAKLAKPRFVKSIGFEVATVYEVIQHITAHTADHVSSINTITDKEKLKASDCFVKPGLNQQNSLAGTH